MNNTISVIIPTYNLSAYLKEALDSVINQTYKNTEIIVVDDGSTDDTGDIVTDYAARHPNKIRYIYQNNRGVAAARNVGITSASGDMIAFLDGDDYYLPNYLEQCSRYMEKYNYDIVIPKYYLRRLEQEHPPYLYYAIGKIFQ